MDAREFLSRPGFLRAELKDAEQKVASLKSLTERCSVAFGPESEPVAHTRNPDAMQDAIIRLSEAKEAAEELKTRLATAELEVGLLIARVESMECREVLEHKYLDGFSNRMTADSMDRSIRWVRMRHVDGLDAVQRILDGGTG